MKYLSDYTQDAQTAAFDKAGAFFAFGQSQLEEKQIKCIKYVGMGAGLICPRNNAEQLIEDLSTTQAAGIKLDIAENGVNAIIQRELGNYECQITGDISDAVAVLEDYGITESQVQAGYNEFWNKCCREGWF